MHDHLGFVGSFRIWLCDRWRRFELFWNQGALGQFFSIRGGGGLVCLVGGSMAETLRTRLDGDRLVSHPIHGLPGGDASHGGQPPKSLNYMPWKKETEAARESRIAIDFFFWLLVICLVIFGTSHYYWYPRVV